MIPSRRNRDSSSWKTHGSQQQHKSIAMDRISRLTHQSDVNGIESFPFKRIGSWRNGITSRHGVIIESSVEMMISLMTFSHTSGSVPKMRSPLSRMHVRGSLSRCLIHPRHEREEREIHERDHEIRDTSSWCTFALPLFNNGRKQNKTNATSSFSSTIRFPVYAVDYMHKVSIRSGPFIQVLSFSFITCHEQRCPVCTVHQD